MWDAKKSDWVERRGEENERRIFRENVEKRRRRKWENWTFLSGSPSKNRRSIDRSTWASHDAEQEPVLQNKPDRPEKRSRLLSCLLFHPFHPNFLSIFSILSLQTSDPWIHVFCLLRSPSITNITDTTRDLIASCHLHPATRTFSFSHSLFKFLFLELVNTSKVSRRCLCFPRFGSHSSLTLIFYPSLFHSDNDSTRLSFPLFQFPRREILRDGTTISFIATLTRRGRYRFTFRSPFSRFVQTVCLL